MMSEPMNNLDMAAPTAPSGSSNRPVGRSRRIRDMLAVNFGNALEWYDWNIYTIFAPIFASQIFQSDDSASALLSTLAVFAVGFIARPVGGYLFGAYADRVGRKKSLFLAMLLTASGSLVIAFTPTFEAAGIVASVILLLARLLQGLAHGGEMGTSVTYLVERAPQSRRALFGSTSWVSVVIGTMLATITGLFINGLLSSDQVASWGWRLAFALGGVLGLYALFLRRTITESETFTEVKEQAQDPEATRPGGGLLQNWKGLLVIFGVSAGGSLGFYTWLIYLPTHAQLTYGMSTEATLTASLIAQVIFLGAILGAGLLGDRIGRKPMVMAFGIIFMVLPFPINAVLANDFAVFLGVQIVTLLGLAVLFGVNGAVWSEALPTSVRAKGVASMLSLATAIFGGTAPYLITWLSGQGLFNIYLVYVMVIAAATLLTGILMKETKNINMND